MHSLHRGHRSQSVMSSVSLQDSQLQFYDAIEDFTSDSDTESESDQDSDVEVASSRKSSKKPTIVPGKINLMKYFISILFLNFKLYKLPIANKKKKRKFITFLKVRIVLLLMQ